MEELGRKLGLIRQLLAAQGLAAVRLRGTDWFAWATCGGSNVVLLTTDTGVADVLVTRDSACVLTDEIEARRLAEEEVPAGLEVLAVPWMERDRIERLVADRASGGRIASDRPGAGEQPLPAELVAARWTLAPEERARYRALGREAAEAMTDVLLAAGPEWTGYELAGAASEALWGRGIEPALTLVGDERRLPIHRHATASHERLGGRAMLVFCARRRGLFANFTRFVYFRPPTAEERATDDAVRRVEAAALDAAVPGTTLGALYDAIVRAYADVGHPGAHTSHHQGGPCGYLSRDAIALPGSPLLLAEGGAVALNPSLPGAKIEDTVIVSGGVREVVTVDPRWPLRAVDGRARPDLLVR